MTLSIEMLAIIALSLVVAGLVYVIFAHRRDAGGNKYQNIEKLIAELSGGLTQIAEEGRASRDALTKAVNEKLDNVTKSMGVSLKESATTTAKSVGEIQTRLKVIDEAQKNLAELSGEIVGFQDLLSNKQARGKFGEVQLERVVADALDPDAYSFQKKLSNDTRPDCLIHLPNPPGPIAVDSKFPFESYRALIDAEDDSLRKKAAQQFRKDMKVHISGISEKYIISGETADSALMFLPSEAIYLELHTNFGEVVELSQKARVYIVSPTTLWALLNTIRAVLRDVKMREQAGVIQKAVGALMRDVELMDKRAGKLSTHFRQVGEDVADIRTSAKRILGKSEKIVSVQLEEGGEETKETIEGPRLRSLE